MLKLIKNEWYKNFFRPRNYLSIILILFVSITNCLFPLLFETDYQKKVGGENWRQEAEDWIQTLEAKREQTENKIKEMEPQQSPNNESMDFVVLEAERNEITEEINRLNYSLDNDIQPVIPNNMFNNLLSIAQMQGIFVLLAVVLAAAMISDEFSKGTIKLLLIRPVPRFIILLSKLLSLFLYILFYIAVAVAATFLISLLISDVNKSLDYVYSIDIYTYEHVNFITVFLENISLLVFTVFIICFLAFCIAIFFRSKSLSISLPLAIYFSAGPVVSFLAGYSSFTKYLWFANWNLNNYLIPFKFKNFALIEGMNLSQSFVINLIYFLLFLILICYLFNKKEIYD
ncbi:ABC transporter permease subunit [Bacillaceae bacterium Marseille-Q3522]|nr:ABC transporter permease subunit [Bacillaceae bacterium Marseille-Q3522]